jgi:spore maturation protein CgeB
MRKAAYVGILSEGSTSRMRAERLKEISGDLVWDWIDTDLHFAQSARAWRTLAFRTNWGKAVDRINAYIVEKLAGEKYDLIWVDKAVFLYPATMSLLRRAANKLVHFTPDTAFHSNRSRHFEKSLRLFDLLVTTKSFEVEDYRRRISSDSLRVVTQGYDPTVHYPRGDNSKRRREALFVGLAEPDRERFLDELVAAGISVRLAGRGWENFLKRHSDSPAVSFEGEDVFKNDYATLLSRSWVGLGLLSKKFPELHTTRTFEIPACGAVLATESTAETERFLSPSEAIFFENAAALAERLAALFRDESPAKLAAMSAAGRARVAADGRDYKSILSGILADPRLS